MTIDDFIKLVVPKLKSETKVTYDKISGDELMLTGIQEVKGKRVEKGKMYRMPVPVIIKVNHEHKLKLAWLRGGKQGVKNYLGRYVNAKVIPTIMGTLNDEVYAKRK
jgi:hypothetical protein